MFAVLFGIFIWSTVYRNTSADVEADSAKISFLNVGQGDATLISLPNNNQVLIDTGKKGTLLNSLSSRMPAFDRKIEAVYLTHPDSDHIGSFEELSRSYKIDKIYYSWSDSNSENAKKVDEIVKFQGISKSTAFEGDHNYLGNLELDVLWPKENLALKDNDSSIVLKAKVKNSKALLTGDIEIKGQKMLLNSGQDLSSDLLKVSHHGSAGAYDESFLNKVGAKNAVISVGKNSYGHPSEVVLEGLKKLGINIYRTDFMGTIDFVATDKGYENR
jgi:competence protein ComEC